MAWTEKSILDRLAQAGLVTSRLYELLPEMYRTQETDAAGVLKAFFGAVQAEYDKMKGSILDTLVLIDPVGINNQFILEGHPTFFDVAQNFTYVNGSAGAIQVDTPVSPVFNNLFNRFGIHIVHDDDNQDAARQYRKVIQYTSSQILVDPPFAEVPGNSGRAVYCWPDRIWIPCPIVADPRSTVDGTILPSQIGMSTTQVRLPGVGYISSKDDFYNDWTLEFLSGELQDQPMKILDYGGSTRILTIEKPYQFGKTPQQGDWFRLTRADLANTTPNYYKNHWVRIMSGPSDSTAGVPRTIQTRRIIRSTYDPLTVPASVVCYVYDTVTGEGELFDVPPDPTSYFGIARNHVSLQYLAKMIGYKVDGRDTEEFQREQIRQAFNFYKLKGTRRAFEIICQSFGFNAEITEVASNFARDIPRFDPYSPNTQTQPVPVYNDVGPGSIADVQVAREASQINAPAEAGQGTDIVPASWLTNPGNGTVQDSDINIWLTRISQKAVLSQDVFLRLAEKLEDVRPIHVEILNIGLAESLADALGLTDSLGSSWVHGQDVLDVLTVADTLTTSQWEDFRDFLDSLGITDRLYIWGEARYSTTGSRFNQTSTTGVIRFNRGRVFQTL